MPKLQHEIRQIDPGDYVDLYYRETDDKGIAHIMHYQGVVDRVWQGGHSFLLKGTEFHTADNAITWRHWTAEDES